VQLAPWDSGKGTVDGQLASLTGLFPTLTGPFITIANEGEELLLILTAPIDTEAFVVFVIMIGPTGGYPLF
jgi:hypothetical protein